MSHKLLTIFCLTLVLFAGNAYAQLNPNYEINDGGDHYLDAAFDAATGTFTYSGDALLPFVRAPGVVVVTGPGGTIHATAAVPAIRKHFMVGITGINSGFGQDLYPYRDYTGTLTIEVGTGQTLTIQNVNNQAMDENGGFDGLGIGGAITVASVASNPLQFTGGGELIFYNNRAETGGAIGFSSGTPEGLAGKDHGVLDLSGIAKITFDSNRATFGDGGAIYAFSGHVMLGNNATFTGNIASYGGGAIQVNDSLTIGDYAIFENNRTGYYGGAISADVGTVTIGTNALFKGNTVTSGNGGAIYAHNNITIGGDSYFLNNTARSNGGAIYTGSSINVITLNAGSGDIAFKGNTVNSVANSIYMNRDTLMLSGNHNFYFDDPIICTSTGNSLVKTGTGFVQFIVRGTAYDSVNSVDVQEGTFRLASDSASGASYYFIVAGSTGTFNVANGAKLAGQGTIQANSFTISGTISPDSDRFQIQEYVDQSHAEATSTNYNYFKSDYHTTVIGGKEISTLSLVGNTAFDGATFAIDIDTPASLDKIAVTGNVTLNGTNTLVPNFNTLPPLASLPVQYTFLTTTGTVDDPTDKVTVGNFSFYGYNPAARGSGVFRETDNKSLYLLLALNNIDLTWTGSESGVWTNDATTVNSGNWTNNNAINLETKFKDGDAVTLNLTGPPQTINIDASGVTVADMTVTGNGNGTINGNMTGDGAASATTLIGRTGKLLKEGTGTLILNGNNEFKGGTTVQAGTLLVEGTTESNTVNVANTATLGGLGTIVGDVTFADGATLSPGNTATPIGTITIDGDAIFNNSKIAVHTNGTNDQVDIKGDASIVAGKMLTLAVAPNDAVVLAKTFDFNTTGTLNIDGYTPLEHTPEYLSSENWQLVIRTTDGVKNFNPAIFVNSHPQVDYLSSSARVNNGINTEVWVETRLSWYSTDPDYHSHGDFTIDGGEFTLGANLANNAIYAWKHRADWNGDTLTKKGSGTLILTGENTYTGVTTVEAGTLFIGNLPASVVTNQASIAGNAEVKSGATLGGHGIIGGNATFASGATLSPGVNDIGTLTVKGNVFFAAGSTYLYEVDKNATANDLLAVEGTVSIQSDAKLNVQFLNAPEQDGDRFLVSTSQGFTGMFVPDGTWLLPMFQEVLFNSTSGYHEYWIYWQQSATPGFADKISGLGTDNAYRAAISVDTIDTKGLTGGIADLYNALGNMSQSDPQALAGAFAQLHGEVFAASGMTLVNMQRNFLGRLPTAQDRHFQACNPDATACDGVSRTDGCVAGHWNRWAALTGNWLERKGIGRKSGGLTSAESGYDLRSTGVVVGMDRKISGYAFGGFAFGYDNAYQHFQTIQSHNQIDAFRTVLYGGTSNGSTYVDGYVGYTKDWNKTRRDININGRSGNGFHAVARSKYGDDLFSTGFEIGERLVFGNVRLIPSTGLHYIHCVSPSVTETGGRDANLYVCGNTYNSLRLPIGTTLSREWVGRHGIVWTPETRVFYVREMADDSTQVVTSFDNVRDVSFVAKSGNWGNNSGRFGVGLNAALANQLSFRVDYDYEVYEHTAMSEFGATLGVRW